MKGSAVRIRASALATHCTWANLRAGRLVQGGSTLTQQLAKTIFLTRKKTIDRKFKELLLTTQIEQRYSKDEILELYLNQIYFGGGAYGVEAAARFYFDKHAQSLNLAECAMLAGLIRSPNRYSPGNSVVSTKPYSSSSVTNWTGRPSCVCARRAVATSPVTRTDWPQ